MIRKLPLVKAQTAFKKTKQKIKYGVKRFSIWQMELLHPAMRIKMNIMWHDHDIDFAR